jgi:hypothetical protein
MSFYICWCGNKEDNHQFKHTYEKKILVKDLSSPPDARDPDTDAPLELKATSAFVLDSNDFETLKNYKCKNEDCTMAKNLHEKDVLGHKYLKRVTNHVCEPNCRCFDSLVTPPVCSICNRPEPEHIHHAFIPLEYTYRKINFTVPEETVCNTCHLPLSDHYENSTHVFKTMLTIENIKKEDIVTISDPNYDDLQISYK